MKFIVVLSLLLLLNACSTAPSRDEKRQTSLSNKIALDNSRAVKSQLMQLHKDWKGTPYRLGGVSKRGVDCSGFVQVGFQKKFGLTLPRTTDEQRAVGRSVSKNNLRPGDLVFFKTGWSTRHVGIYIGNHQFLHASTSQGVMISSLDNSYWKQKYWLSRRL
ncbi:Lipoprotein, NLP/P60 family [Shewanella piezotolerans WP3]|uniref:Lipoprotein, NLP/P60 family n=1 Tax=Shewanella piezotolerans (strain WP3 / JCM 13877) TaxID=225849 RepID=B8CGV2_SHEPW|nr:NlpC/P60 family protein [Shewanella piezotolerans]ACJ26945.1 Lipoprotein, NLP/P60 family [Shewanella piezotolerans WP3]